MDTSDPLSLNLYTYCGNNPVMYVDSSGHNLQKRSESIKGLIDVTHNQYQIVWYSTFQGHMQLLDKYGPMIADPINFAIRQRVTHSFDSFIGNKNAIIQIANEYSISPEIIASIIFKEQLTQSIPDSIAIASGYIFNGKHSTGLGAIRASTAQEAWGYVDSTIHLPENYAVLQHWLAKDDKFNIRTIAIILVYEAFQLNLIETIEDMNNLTTEEWKSVLTRYNGSSVYADKVTEYLPFIKSLLE